MCQNEVEVNGWTSMPANAGAIFGDEPFINVPEALSIDEIKFPTDDPIVEKTLRYAKTALPIEIVNHSMRVYYYGMVITKQQFPKQASALSPSTWALTCLLHDIAKPHCNSDLIHDTTRSQVHGAHPPGEWRTFFSSVIQKEQAIKPWCHTKKMVNVMRNRSQHPDEQ
ncbi:hypothetical protein GB937_004470 [Aspergillus fischeri]|nr:hypothetical protein GB937_004470 [Aspergillus fischeri]